MAFTVKEIKQAEETGITLNTVRNRMKKGWSKEKALNTPSLKRNMDKYYKIAEKNGIKKGTVKVRIYQYGWDIEEAVTKPVRNGYYKKKHEEAVKNGLDITYMAFMNRLHKGWTLEDALNTKKLTNRRAK